MIKFIERWYELQMMFLIKKYQIKAEFEKIKAEFQVLIYEKKKEIYEGNSINNL